MQHKNQILVIGAMLADSVRGIAAAPPFYVIFIAK